MRLLTIASGSSGNCIYVGSDTTHILIDAGISKKKTEEGLALLGLSLDDLDAIFITHEHRDHVAGLGVVTRKCDAPVYATADTMDAIFAMDSLGKLDKSQFHPIKAAEHITVGDLTIDPMSISHDAADPVAYRIFYQEKKVAIATDMGYVTAENEAKLKGMDVILLEANHDVRMVEMGPYPYELKRRVLSNLGHLSNETAGRLLSRIVHPGLKHIVLGHLSHENNYPHLAYQAVRLEITMGDNPFTAEDFTIQVAKRDVPGEIIDF